jgi:hypothetical protein
MMVTVPALTAPALGNVHRVASDVKTGSALFVGGATVWAVALCNQRLAAATASIILVRFPIQFSLAPPNSMR